MLNQELLAAYFVDALAPAERAQAEQEIATDQDSQRALANQQLMEQALRVALGRPEADERVKQSVLAVVRATSIEQLRAHVLAETSERQTTISSPAYMSPEAKNGVATAHWTAPRRTIQARVAAALRFEFSAAQRFAAAAVLLAIGLGIYLFNGGPKLSTRVEVGEFAVVIGTPTIRHAGERSTLNAQRSTPIYLGDHIETGDADRAEVQFRDGTTLRLHFNTALEIPNPKSESSNRQLAIGNRPSATSRPDARTFQHFNASTLQRPPELNLLRGQVWTKVQKITNAPQYAVRTPVATAVARGTEFGLKIQKADKSTLGTQNSKLETNLMAVLTVKEGAVDFFNSFGKIQATAMTESTARAGARPTEPKRVQTLQVVRLTDSREWAVITSPLNWPEAAERLVQGGGSAGFKVRDFPSASTNAVAGARATIEVRVINVARQSPADRAGLQMGDIVLAANGRAVTTASELEKAILVRPNGATRLSVRRGDEEKSVALTATNRTSILPGPALSPAQDARLSEVTRQLVEDNAGPVTPTFQSANSPVENWRYAAASSISSVAVLRAAAQNNLGVVYEIDDAMGPAIRAYGLAIYVDPQVPLYHFNLGLALRKIGSFERALEELETASRLAPQSMPARKRCAEIHSLLGDDSEALALTDAALQADPRDHGAWELKTQLLSKQNRAAEAREAAVKAVQLDPDCAVAHGYLAGALSNQRNFGEAIAAYRKALELAPFDSVLHMNLGIVQKNLQQLWLAEQSLCKAIELRPDFALAYRNLGNVLSDGRDFAQAAAALRKAVELDPDDAAAHRDLGQVDLKQRQFGEAEKSFLKALDIFPTDAESYYGLGQAHRERRQYAKAELMYRKAIDLKPDYANAHTGLGLVFHGRGQFDEAEKLYRKAIELDPKDSSPYHNLGEIYREARGQLDEAEKFYRKALAISRGDSEPYNGLAMNAFRWWTPRKLSPDDAEPYSGLGLVAVGRGNLAEAEKMFRKALALQPDSSLFNNNLGEVYRLRGQLEEAERLYRKALELDPDNIAPYGNLGILLHMRRQFDEAEKVFRALLQRSSGNDRLPALVNLASVCGDQGKLEEAEQVFRQALAISPNEPHVCNGLAYFLAEHGLKLDEALALSRRAVQAAPNDANNLDTLGWVYFQRGELSEAETTLKKALDLAGQDPPASEIREHLKKVQEKKGTPLK